MRKTGRILRIVFDAVCVCLILIALTAVFFVLQANRTGGDVTFFGRQFRIVLTQSMDGPEALYEKEPFSHYRIKRIPTDSLVGIETCGEDVNAFFADLSVGDVITFVHLDTSDYREKVVTHRIVKIDYNESYDAYVVTTQGDANPEEVTETVTSQGGKMIGKVTFSNLTLGRMLKFVQSKIGIFCVVILPAGILLLVEVVRLILVLSARKRERAAERSPESDAPAKSKDEEIAELKKRLSELSGTDSEENSGQEDFDHSNEEKKEIESDGDSDSGSDSERKGG